jgi:hypothetical protein
MVRKYASNGILVWSMTYDGSCDESVNKITVDLIGNVLAAGVQKTAASFCFAPTWYAMQYNPTGMVSGIFTYAPPGVEDYQDSGVIDVAAGPNGVSYMLGEVMDAYMIRAVLFDGRLLWSRTITIGGRIASDEQGNVYVAWSGWSGPEIKPVDLNRPRDLFLAKYSLEGKYFWGRVLPVSTKMNDQLLFLLSNNQSGLIIGAVHGEPFVNSPYRAPPHWWSVSGVSETGEVTWTITGEGVLVSGCSAGEAVIFSIIQTGGNLGSQVFRISARGHKVEMAKIEDYQPISMTFDGSKAVYFAGWKETDTPTGAYSLDVVLRKYQLSDLFVKTP